MRNLRKIAAAVLAAVLPAVGCGAAGAGNRLEDVLASGRLVVATEPYFAPYEFLDNSKTGQDAIRGADVELAKYIAAGLGVELKLVPLSFSAVLAGTSQGKYDLAISGLAYTPLRARNLELSDVYKPGSEQGLLVRAADAGKYLAFESFAGKRVGFHSGTLQEQLVTMQMKDSEHRVFDTVQNAVLALGAGKVDAVAVSVLNGDNFVAANPALTVLPLRFRQDKSGACAAAAKGETELIARVNELIAEVVTKDLYSAWEKSAVEEAARLRVK